MYCTTNDEKSIEATTAVHDRARLGGIPDSSYSKQHLARRTLLLLPIVRLRALLLLWYNFRSRGAAPKVSWPRRGGSRLRIRYDSCNLCRALFSQKQDTMFRICMPRPLLTEEHSPVPITIPAATEAPVPSGEMPPFVPCTKPTTALVAKRYRHHVEMRAHVKENLAQSRTVQTSYR